MHTISVCLVYVYFTRFCFCEPLRPDDCDDGYFLATWTDPVQCMPCGFCKDGAICDKAFQTCPDGCQEWYVPPGRCSHYLTSHEDFTALGHIIDGPTTEVIDGYKVKITFEQNQDLVQYEWARYYVYTIQYAKQDDDFEDDQDYIPIQNGLVITKIINNLVPYNDYRFRVALHRVFENTLYDAIAFSGVSHNSTPCAVPPNPELISVVPLPGLTSARVTWKPLEWSRCKLYIYFRVYIYLKTNTTNFSWHNLPVDGDPSGVIYNIEPERTYVVRLYARNSAPVVQQSWSAYHDLAMTQEKLHETRTQTSTNEEHSGANSGAKNALVYVSLALAIVAVLGIAAIFVFLLYKKRSSCPDGSSNRACDNPGYKEEQHVYDIPSTE